jgi:hypothetical protein
MNRAHRNALHIGAASRDHPRVEFGRRLADQANARIAPKDRVSVPAPPTSACRSEYAPAGGLAYSPAGSQMTHTFDPLEKIDSGHVPHVTLDPSLEELHLLDVLIFRLAVAIAGDGEAR